MSIGGAMACSRTGCLLRGARIITILAAFWGDSSPAYPKVSSAFAKRRVKPGAKPEVLNIDADDWKQAVGQATQLKRPEDGWPKPDADPDNAESPHEGKPE
jgi:hypothetical protein